MIYDEVSVFNLALNAVGARNNVESTTESSREAEVCRLWYAVVRDTILASASWPSARAFKRLGNIATAPDDGEWVDGSPEPGFAFGFSVPDDMIQPRHLTSYGRFTLTARTATQLMLNTNEETPILVYTRRATSVALWDTALGMAVVYGLAANIAKPLTGKRQLAIDLLNQANMYALEARVQAANLDANAIEQVPDWLTIRGSSAYPTEKFLYNYGPLLTVMSSGT